MLGNFQKSGDARERGAGTRCGRQFGPHQHGRHPGASGAEPGKDVLPGARASQWLEVGAARARGLQAKGFEHRRGVTFRRSVGHLSRRPFDRRARHHSGDVDAHVQVREPGPGQRQHRRRRHLFGRRRQIQKAPCGAVDPVGDEDLRDPVDRARARPDELASIGRERRPAVEALAVGHAQRCPSPRGIHHIQRVLAGTTGVGRKHDVGAGRMEEGRDRAGAETGKLRGVRAVHVDREDLGDGASRFGVLVNDSLAVGAERRSAIVARRCRQTADAEAVRVHEVNIHKRRRIPDGPASARLRLRRVPVAAVGRERDRAAARRVDRLAVVGRRFGQVQDDRVVGVKLVKLEVVGEPGIARARPHDVAAAALAGFVPGRRKQILDVCGVDRALPRLGESLADVADVAASELEDIDLLAGTTGLAHPFEDQRMGVAAERCRADAASLERHLTRVGQRPVCVGERDRTRGACQQGDESHRRRRAGAAANCP